LLTFQASAWIMFVDAVRRWALAALREEAVVGEGDLPGRGAAAQSEVRAVGCLQGA
jgi:hypothetical protein